MKLSEKKQCENECSNCGSTNIKWEAAEVNEGFVKQGWTCEDCEAEGYEFSDIIYIGSQHLIED